MAQARGWVAPAIPEALARARGQAVAQVTVGSEPALREQAPAAWVAGEAELESARQRLVLQRERREPARPEWRLAQEEPEQPEQRSVLRVAAEAAGHWHLCRKPSTRLPSTAFYGRRISSARPQQPR